MKILVEGSTCRCSKGTIPSTIISAGNSRVRISKMKVIVKNDVTMMPPSFGICQELTQKAGGTAPVLCAPILLNWKTQVDDNKADGKILVTEKDKLSCSFGGEITVINNLNRKMDSNK